jgi:mycothiol synthase
MSVAPPRLRMGFRQFEGLVAPESVPGYGVRTFRPGDEDAWIAILQTGELGVWDRPRLDEMMRGARAELPTDGIFFATCAGRPVGTACTLLHPGDEGPVAELGWVAVAPEHRGRALGLQVCRAVLAFIHRLGYGYAYLLTDDFRLPAISTYLRLGFEPEIADPSHPGRWAALQQALTPTDGGQMHSPVVTSG